MSAAVLIAAIAVTVEYRTHHAAEPAFVARNATVSQDIAAAKPPADEPQVRALRNPAAGPAVIAPAEGQSVAAGPTFRWESLPNALNYDVRVLNAEGNTVWHTTTTADQVQLPGGALLQRGQRYFVLISASLRNGKTVHARAVSFHIATNRD